MFDVDSLLQYDDEENKVCSKCLIKKSRTQFSPRKKSKDGLYGRCKQCVVQSSIKYLKTNKGKIAVQKYNNSDKGRATRTAWKRENKYGVGPLKMYAIAVKQNHRCGLCFKDFSEVVPCIDHNHTTGKIRGLLCRSCNTALGWYENRKDLVNKWCEQ